MVTIQKRWMVAAREAKSVTDKPSLLCCKTIIGFGSPNKANSHDCHGSGRWVQMKWRWCVNVCNGRMPLSKFLVKFMPNGMRPRKARRFNRNGMHCSADYAKQWPELAAEFTLSHEG